MRAYMLELSGIKRFVTDADAVKFCIVSVIVEAEPSLALL